MKLFIECGEIAETSFLGHLGDVLALVAVFEEKLAGLEDSVLEIGQVGNVILMEILLVDHDGNKAAAGGVGDDLIHLIHYPINGLEVENKVDPSEKDVLVGVIPEVALTNVVDEVVGSIVSNQGISLCGVLKVAGQRGEAHSAKRSCTLLVSLAEVDGGGVVDALGACKANDLAADLDAVLCDHLSRCKLIGLAGKLAL